MGIYLTFIKFHRDDFIHNLLIPRADHNKQIPLKAHIQSTPVFQCVSWMCYLIHFLTKLPQIH